MNQCIYTPVVLTWKLNICLRAGSAKGLDTWDITDAVFAEAVPIISKQISCWTRFQRWSAIVLRPAAYELPLLPVEVCQVLECATSGLRSAFLTLGCALKTACRSWENADSDSAGAGGFGVPNELAPRGCWSWWSLDHTSSSRNLGSSQMEGKSNICKNNSLLHFADRHWVWDHTTIMWIERLLGKEVTFC